MEQSGSNLNADAGTSSHVSWEDYRRAESFLPWNAEKLISGLRVSPNWIDESDRFWYRVQCGSGYQFITVDPKSGTREPAFDHTRMAASLSQASEHYYVGDNLPFREIKFVHDSSAVQFQVGDATWECDLGSYDCKEVDGQESIELTELLSPNGDQIAFAKDSNLWVRDKSGGGKHALTTDGEPGYGYGLPIMTPLIDAGLAKPDYFQFPIAELIPAAIWSPDSKKIVSHRLDERDVGQYHLIQSVPLDGSIRQRLHSFTYPLPGDEKVPKAELVVCHVDDQRVVSLDVPSLDVLFFGSPLRRKKDEMKSDLVWWGDNSDKLYILRKERGYFALSLYEADADTGESRLLVRETSNTPIDPHLTSAGGVNVRVVDNGALVIWFSQRDGWGHLYLYDGETGELKNQITSGAWAVADIMHVDETNRRIYFTGVARESENDPYEEYLYSVSFDGGDPQLLTPGPGDHSVQFSPSGAYFVDSCSRVYSPPVTVLCDVDGQNVAILETADASALQSSGWQFPERFSARARDGVTDVYGVIFRPSNFDPDRKYPVIDNIYAGPQVNQAPVSFADTSRGRRSSNFWQAQALAELGFIVVMVDGLGMPYRSKANHDFSYGNLGDAGLPDHIAAIRQLAVRYPYIDLERVGIFGHSGGGYASCRAIFMYPDFFKVCVSTAGNHDDPTYAAGWTERYMGLPVGDHYFEQSNRANADRLEGKLLLIHGEMDENVHLACSLVVVDELIKANKDFDLLVMPNRTHACTEDPYFIRKRWDYFVEHLLGADPPKGYQIQEDPES